MSAELIQRELEALPGAHKASAKRVFRLLKEDPSLIDEMWDKTRLYTELELKGYKTATINTSLGAFYKIIRAVEKQVGKENLRAVLEEFLECASLERKKKALGIVQEEFEEVEAKKESVKEVQKVEQKEEKAVEEAEVESVEEEQFTQLLTQQIEKLVNETLNFSNQFFIQIVLDGENLEETSDDIIYIKLATMLENGELPRDIDQSWVNLLQTKFDNPTLLGLIVLFVSMTIAHPVHRDVLSTPIQDLDKDVVIEIFEDGLSKYSSIDDNTVLDDLVTYMTVDLVKALGLEKIIEEMSVQSDEGEVEVEYPKGVTTTKLAGLSDFVKEVEETLGEYFTIDRSKGIITFANEKAKDVDIMLRLLQIAQRHRVALILDNHFNIEVKLRDSSGAERI